MSPGDIPRSSGLELAVREAELNVDVLAAQGGLPGDERHIVWKLLDMLVANAITLAILLALFWFVGR